MNSFRITKSKVGFKITCENSPIELDISCQACTSIYKHNDSYVYKVHLKTSDIDKIHFIEKQCREYITKTGQTSFVSCIFDDNKLIVKIPFRYKKFEAQFKDTDNSLLTAYDIKEGDNVNILLNCSDIWSFNNVCGITMKSKQIIKENTVVL